MRERQQSIEHHMDYCQHYKRGKGSIMICSAGMDLEQIKRVPVGKDQIKWGPCIKGHLLENPTAHCPHWVRRTQESAEAYADSVEKSIQMMTATQPLISRIKKQHKGTSWKGIEECPVCKGKLHMTHAAYNGHVWGKCETKDCLHWIE